MLEAQGTLYYKVLLQYYKVLLQSYKVLLQYYQVLLQYWLRQHGSSTTKYYILYHKVLLQSHIQWHLQCAGQEVTQYCACPAKSLACLILVAYDVIYNARSSKIDPPTSPNTTPATQNESKHWSAWHMKRHLQCAEQAKSPSNLTKYCACHEILKLKISAETPWSASANRKTIRG